VAQHYSDDEIADSLDRVGREVARLRRMIPGMSLDQLLRVAEACPFPSGDPADALLDLDTWAVVSASAMRSELLSDVDMAG
jgi:hypothetical protein